MPLYSSRENGLSFGIELEVIVCHAQKRATPPEKTTEVSAEEEAVMPPIMTAPPQTRPGDLWVGDSDNLDWLQDQLEKIILTVPGARYIARDGALLQAPGPNLHPSVYLTPTTAWAAKADCSVTDNLVWAPEGLAASGVEIISPAMWDCPAAHRHVQDVVVAMSSVLRWRVNLRTGFHVHVGAGATERIHPETGKLEWKNDKFDFEVFQRAAALIWAADRFLHCAHPAERQINHYSQSISLTSQLVVGQEYLNVKVSGTMDEAENDEVNYSVEHERKLSGRFPNPTLPPRPPPMVPAIAPPSTTKLRSTLHEKGIAYILRAQSRHKIAKLLSGAGNDYARLNYNFTHYEQRDIKGYNTVEFREAAGTFDPTTIAAWSGVCLSIFRFCTVAKDASYWNVVWNLIDANNAALADKPHNYDMISFMVDIGALAEATFFEKSLRELGDKHWYTSIQNNTLVSNDPSKDTSPEDDYWGRSANPVGDTPSRSRQGSVVAAPSFFDLDWPVPGHVGTLQLAPPSPPTGRASTIHSKTASTNPSRPGRRPQTTTTPQWATDDFWRPPNPTANTIPTSPTTADSPPPAAESSKKPSREEQDLFGDSFSRHFPEEAADYFGEVNKNHPLAEDMEAFQRALRNTTLAFKNLDKHMTAKADAFDAKWEELGFPKRPGQQKRGE
ncbi:hypothetical protein QBC41DRAFT_141372 [Cercophora samala]|uniref:Uncharacterized protein n=1 Tax=Cercophora samala TaxID=330535 RepID=A0AA39ZAA0_9PEZI|nr:hypothetical protein QBC41DRAFT_141372 [Cercophora samala]